MLGRSPTIVLAPPHPPPHSGEAVELQTAALNGDVNFLQRCIATNKPTQYYYTQFPISPKTPHLFGNIFHLAVSRHRVEFIREACKNLVPEATQHLLLQHRSPNNMSNPLHLAASIGNLDIVELFLEFYTPLLPLLSKHDKPWLSENGKGITPCYVAIASGKQECALRILRMDMEIVTNMVDDQGRGLLYQAVFYGLKDVALAILASTTSFTISGEKGLNPLHVIPRCSDAEELCKGLIRLEVPNLVKAKSNTGMTILHYWAKEGKVWPFKCIVDNTDSSTIVSLLSTLDDTNGDNPVHVLAASAPSEADAVKIAAILMDTYKAATPSVSSGDSQSPWVAKNKAGATPLFLSLNRQYENLAMHILKEEKDALKEGDGENLLLAIKKRCHKAAESILDKVGDHKRWTKLTDHQNMNALHLAPICTKEFVERLIKGDPELLEGVTTDGRTVLHTWLEEGEVWPFKHILQNPEMDEELKRKIHNLISRVDNRFRNNCFHHAAIHYKGDTTNEIVKLLVDAFNDLAVESRFWPIPSFPWFTKNADQKGPLHLAISNQQQSLALDILGLYPGDEYSSLLEFYDPTAKIIFLSIENNCYRVAKKIMEKLPTQSWGMHLLNASDERNVLHLASSCTDKEFGKWLVTKAPEYIKKADSSGKTPVDEAIAVGAEWILPTMLKVNRGPLEIQPLAWIKACETGQTSIIRAFMKSHRGRFIDYCQRHGTSPLHHIVLSNLSDYEEFLQIPQMKDVINVPDSQGSTPLHKAIETDNICLTEALLKMNDIRYDIKDSNDDTARGLLEKKCKDNSDWNFLSEKIGFVPYMKTPFFKQKENLDVRNTLAMVAALIATITFTAGFTIPGGFDQNNGEAILAKRAVFLVFLISDTLAMCCSMLVLICLILSMVYNTYNSLLLIDRSMTLLMLSLYSTILAFMTGVFIVISHKSLWAAILIIILCSLLGISVRRALLFKFLESLVPSANKEHEDLTCLLELGKVCCRGDHDTPERN